jgi:hypothetical protein
MLVYFMDIWYILRPFGYFYGHFVVIWLTFSHFGMLYQEKSGNPGFHSGLPDGHFSYQKIPICVDFVGSSNGRCWIVYVHLAYCVAIWYILPRFGTFFPRFGMLHQEKSGNPGFHFHLHVCSSCRANRIGPMGDRGFHLFIYVLDGLRPRCSLGSDVKQ